MNSKLLKLVILTSKLTLYGFAIQCLLMTTLWASIGNAQTIESVRKVFIELELQNADITEAFRQIEFQTDFKFAFDDQDIQKNKKITIINSELTVADALLKISKNFDLKFRQVNDYINVKKKRKNEKFLEVVIDGIPVTGRVTDEYSEGLPGVNIIVKGTTQGTITDTEGNYKLNVPDENTVLVFSAVGFIRQEVLVGNNTIIDINMIADVTALDEIVVVGYGTKDKVELTSAVSVVNSEFISNKPITSTSQVLQGVQGLYVSQPGGQPGRDQAEIVIRGRNSYSTSASPLVLVDGVEFDFNFINPADIESITVLKDAAAAAIYGSRASNGVILVNTKKGSKGAPFTLTYSNYFGFQEVVDVPNMNSDPVQHMELFNQARINSGLTALYEDQLIAEWKANAGTDDFVYPHTDWSDLFYQRGFVQDHTINMQGGTDKSRFNITLGYQDQDGVFYENATTSDRYTLGLSYEIEFGKRFTIGGNFKGSLLDRREPPTLRSFSGDLGNNASGTVNWLMYRALPFHAPYNSDGSYHITWMSVPNAQVFRNPVALATEGYTKDRIGKYLTQVYAEYKLPFNFTLKTNFAAAISDRISRAHSPALFGVDLTGRRSESLNALNFIFDPSRSSPVARRSAINSLNITSFTTLNYEKMFNNHTLSGILGFSFETFSFEDFHISVTDFPVNDLTDVGVFGSINTRELGKGFAGSTRSNKLLSYFGRVNYDYKKKYFFEATVRYDGSTQFAEEHRYGLFPSISGAWRIDNESFMENSGLFDLLKLRVSWGQLGNQNIGNYQYLATVNLGTDYTLGGGDVLGAAVTKAANPVITWETVTTSNIGVESILLNGKLGVTFDYFIKNTEGILGTVRLPAQVGGLDGPTKNFGTVENKGYELGINFNNTAGNFRYNISGALMHVSNKITALEPGVTERIEGIYINRVGYPINSYYLIESDGIIRNQQELDNTIKANDIQGVGDLSFVDANVDGEINGNDRRIFADGVYPDLTYSFSLGGGYKGLALDLFFEGIQGRSVYFNHNLALPFHNGAGVTQDWIDNAFSDSNPNSEYPRLFTSFGDSPNKMKSSFRLKDASYLRLQNIQLSYNIPASKWFSKFKVFVNARNLFTIDDLVGFDPERAQNDSDKSGWKYPSVRTFTAGVNVTF